MEESYSLSQRFWNRELHTIARRAVIVVKESLLLTEWPTLRSHFIVCGRTDGFLDHDQGLPRLSRGAPEARPLQLAEIVCRAPARQSSISDK